MNSRFRLSRSLSKYNTSGKPRVTYQIPKIKLVGQGVSLSERSGRVTGHPGDRPRTTEVRKLSSRIRGVLRLTEDAAQPLTSPVHDSTPLAGPTSSPRPRDDSPLAIYARYVRARSAWYETQLPGARVGRQCREAAGLPLQYGKEEFKWCLDSKQMTERCTTSAGSRDWTKEEMMAYLDWDNAEGERVQLIVDKIGPNFGRNRGMGYIWEMVDEDFHR